MKARTSVTALLAVVAVSIVFGAIVGAKLKAPPVAFAAGPAPSRIAATDPGGEGSIAPAVDFSDVAERAIPAVVFVRKITILKPDESPRGDRGGIDDQLFQWFFGPNDPHRSLPRERRDVSSGSGFIVSSDGYVMTNNHVIEGATKVEVTLAGGDRHEAKVVGTDPVLDFALLKIDGQGVDLPTLPLGDSDRLRIGQWVMAIGNPLQFDSSVTVGVVSGKKRNAYIGATIPGLANIIQTDAAINFGNSGGPLLDAQGRVVGINTAIQRGGPDGLVEGIGFAIAINEARAAADQIRETGTVRRGFLGIGMNGQGITPSVRDYYGLPDLRGVLVDDVTRGGPAAKAGLKPGDVIRKIDGEPIGANADLLSKVGALPPGRKIRVEVIREGKPFEADITLGLRPTDIASDAADEPGEPEPEEPDVTETTGLGVTVSAITPYERQRRRLPAGIEGVIVTDVEPDSPAADLIEANRVIITSVNDQPVRSPAEWARATRGLEPGQAVKIGVRTQGRATSLFLTVPKAAN